MGFYCKLSSALRVIAVIFVLGVFVGIAGAQALESSATPAESTVSRGLTAVDGHDR